MKHSYSRIVVIIIYSCIYIVVTIFCLLVIRLENICWSPMEVFEKIEISRIEKKYNFASLEKFDEAKIDYLVWFEKKHFWPGDSGQPIEVVKINHLSPQAAKIDFARAGHAGNYYFKKIEIKKIEAVYVAHSFILKEKDAH